MDIHVHKQEVADGVLVFRSIEPARERAALGGVRAHFGVADTGADPVERRRCASAGGRGFFAGGISPRSIRSYTSVHRARSACVAKDGDNASRFSPPFFVSASWQS